MHHRLAVTSSPLTRALAWPLLAALLLGFVWFQAPALDKPFWEYDEGLNVIKAQLVGEGYWPHRDIWSDQPPLFTLLLRLQFALFGATLPVGRAMMVGWASLLLLATAWTTTQLAGRWAGVGAALLLALAPMLQELGRTILIGLPAIALGVLAIAAAWRARQTPHLAWWALAGALFGLGMLTKPLIAPYYAPLLLCALWPRANETSPRPWWQRLVALHVAPALLLLITLALFGARPFLRQVLGTFTSARDAYGFSLTQNLAELWTSLGVGYYPGLMATALLSLALWAYRRQTAFWLLCAWLGATVLAVVLHTPQRWHEHLLLLPPLCTLAAALLPNVIGLTSQVRGWQRGALWLVTGACLGGLLAGLPATVNEALTLRTQPLKEGRKAANTQLALDLLIRETPPGSTIITDDPMLAFLTGHTVPPQLAVPSLRRITSGSITADEVVALTQQQPIAAILFWQNRLDRLTPFFEWARTHFALRATRSEHWFFAPANPAWPQEASTPAGLALLGSSLHAQAVDPGSSVKLELYWRAETDIAAPYTLFVHLVDAQGAVWGQHDLKPFEQTDAWRAGDIFVLHVNVPIAANTPAGPKLLSVGWYDEAGHRLDFTTPDGQPLPGGQIILAPQPVVHWPAAYEPPVPAMPTDIALGDVARLAGYDLALSPTPDGRTAHLTLFWQALAQTDRNYKVFVHIVALGETVVAQSDAEPDAGAKPTSAWRSGEYLADRHTLAVPADTGPLTLYVGLYDPTSGARLPVTVAGVARDDGRAPLTEIAPND